MLQLILVFDHRGLYEALLCDVVAVDVDHARQSLRLVAVSRRFMCSFVLFRVFKIYGQTIRRVLILFAH